MAEQGLQGEQRIEVGALVGLALQEAQHHAGEGVAQRVKVRSDADAFRGIGEHRADATRRIGAPVRSGTACWARHSRGPASSPGE